MVEKNIPKVFGVSVMGSSHKSLQTPCQDDNCYKKLPSDEIIIAVADGLGSASHSQLGSELAVRTAVEQWEEVLKESSRPVEFKPAAEEVFRRCLRALEAKALEKGLKPRDLACTMILVACDQRGVCTAHIGDGAVVVRTKNGSAVLSEPGDSEYANEVTPLTSKGWEAAVRYRGPVQDVFELAVFTDGCQRAALSKKGGPVAAHEGFFNPLLNFAQKLGDVEEGKKELAELLNSPKICEHSDDDKTLVIAVLKSWEGALPSVAKPPSGEVRSDAGKAVPDASSESVLIPAGEFQMGSPESVGGKDEHPRHGVFVNAFRIGKYLVTVAEYRKFTQDTGRPWPEQPAWSSPRHPVVNVTWRDAWAYCEWAYGRDGRLPTEAEWEKAARAESATLWHFGDDEARLGDYCWFEGNSQGRAHEVGKKKPNQYGLYDMAGNVFEWVLDSYHASYSGARKDGVAWADPDDSSSVVRGGAWNSEAKRCRPAYRLKKDRNTISDDVGFRCVTWEAGVGYRQEYGGVGDWIRHLRSAWWWPHVWAVVAVVVSCTIAFFLMRHLRIFDYYLGAGDDGKMIQGTISMDSHTQGRVSDLPESSRGDDNGDPMPPDASKRKGAKTPSRKPGEKEHATESKTESGKPKTTAKAGLEEPKDIARADFTDEFLKDSDGQRFFDRGVELEREGRLLSAFAAFNAAGKLGNEKAKARELALYQKLVLQGESRRGADVFMAIEDKVRERIKVIGKKHSADAENRRAAEERKIEWIRITGGKFRMGSNDGNFFERPPHPVLVKTFEISKTEVTVAQYQACVDAKKCSKPSGNRWDAAPSSSPITHVSWLNAGDFCKWVGGRLPTEAEWEYAARSRGKEKKYPWGDDAPTCEKAVMNDGDEGCGKESPATACSKPLGNTEQGLCDMAGNVGEWTQDWYHDSYVGAPSKGEEAWEVPPGQLRVFRGGSWRHGAAHMRVANRGRSDGLTPHRDVGFRCVRGARK